MTTEEPGIVSIIPSIRKCILNWKNYKDRAGRFEFFSFLFFGLISILLGSMIDQVLRIHFFYALFTLLWLIPFVAVGARRFHDIDTTGWCAIFFFIPVIGFVTQIGMCFVKGTSGENRFGPPPVIPQ